MTSIQAYASLTSVLPEKTIDFMVSYDHGDSSPAFTIDIYREGVAEVPIGDQVGGLEADLQDTPPDFNGNGCRWPVAYSLPIPADWASGVYIARLTGSTGDTADFLFVVKAAVPGSNSKILLSITVTTAQAYNAWGGTSLYTTPRAVKVSFDRPGGLMDTFRQYGEQRFIAWAEGNGFELEYCTSIDLHAERDFLDSYQLLLSVGHDEYWSKEMRDNVEAFVNNGGSAAFFSANTCWWQVRFENDDRTMVCYKSDEDPTTPDPITDIDPRLATVRWFNEPVLRPENSLTGVSFRSGAGWWGWTDSGLPIPDRRYRGYTVTNGTHWVFDGTGLSDGDEFGRGTSIDTAIMGYETDSAAIIDGNGSPVVSGADGTPPNFIVMARADLSDWPSSPNVPDGLSQADQEHWLHGDWGQAGSATMGLYQLKGAAFTAGTILWANGLSLDGSWTPVDQMTQNVLRRLSCLCPPSPEIVNSGFEEWADGLPVAWALEGAGAVGAEQADRDPNFPGMIIDAGGHFSLRVDANEGETWISQSGFLCAAKTTYGVGCWAKAYGPGVTLRLQSTITWFDFAQAIHSGSGEWEYLYAVGAAQDETPLFSARVKIQVAGGQIAWFDSVSITEVAGSPSWNDRRPIPQARMAALEVRGKEEDGKHTN